MKITVHESKNEEREVVLRIKSGRVKGFGYAMLKALLEDGSVGVFAEGMSPSGESAKIVSTSLDQAEGTYTSKSGQPLRPEDFERDGLVIMDSKLKQSDCNWTTFYDVRDSVYIDSGDIGKAAHVWAKRGLI